MGALNNVGVGYSCEIGCFLLQPIRWPPEESEETGKIKGSPTYPETINANIKIHVISDNFLLEYDYLPKEWNHSIHTYL